MNSSRQNLFPRGGSHYTLTCLKASARMPLVIGALTKPERYWLNVRFYIDPKTGLPHIYRHEVNENEVEDVLRRPGEDSPGREGSRVAIGQTQAGRYLRVIYVPDPEPDSVFVIMAYALEGKPLIAYRRRRRRRQK